MAVDIDPVNDGAFIQTDGRIWWLPIKSLQIIVEFRVLNGKGSEHVSAFVPEFDLKCEANCLPDALDLLSQVLGRGGIAPSLGGTEVFPLIN